MSYVFIEGSMAPLLLLLSFYGASSYEANVEQILHNQLVLFVN